MEDRNFSIYSERYASMKGEIRNGCLHIELDVYGDDYDSEAHYTLVEAETERLFSIISPDDFIALCREGHVKGMLDLFETNNIDYSSYVF